MLKVTSICGDPRGAGGMSVRLNVPSRRLSLANSRSPCNTLIVTAVWLSAAVEKVSALGVRNGRVPWDQRRSSRRRAFRRPGESGVTSSTRMSLTSPVAMPP